ncbi:MAG: HAD-IA family hydrolase [Pseudomonadota bacterium]
MTAPRLVVFDCDGTLADSQFAITSAMQTAFTACGLTAPARADVLAVVGLSLPIAIAKILQAQNSSAQTFPKQACSETVNIAALAEAYKSAFKAQRAKAEFDEPLYPGIRELLEKLAAQPETLLGVATGKSMRGLRALLDRQNLTDLFTTLQTADTHPSKPHPAMLQAALTETGAEPQHAMLVGDTVFDMEMARACGVTAIGVSWGYHPADDLTQSGARHVAHSADQLADVLMANLEPAR